MNELTFKGSDSIQAVAWLASYVETLQADKRYTVTVKEKKERRSLDANAYFWVMCDKLAEHLHMEKTEIYKQYIKEIGGVSDTVCVLEKAADKLCENWESKGIGFQTERMPSKMPKCVNVVLYYGSSTYDKAQMSRLIDMVVQDCKEYDIETYDQSELDTMLEAWNGNADGR
jgi:hypothetical protein